MAATCVWKAEFIEARKGDEHHCVPAYAAHRPACRAILGGRYFEPMTHDFIHHLGAMEVGDLVHAGTFFGDMIPSFCKAFSGGTVYCFEPSLENYVLARLCVERNGTANALLFNAALSDSVRNHKIRTLDSEGVHLGGASEIGGTGATVPSLTIDQFAFRNLICIQLDVEGHELFALKGAVQSLDIHQPVVMIEDNHRTCADFLTQRGYAHVLDIPGLQVWVTARRLHMVRSFVEAETLRRQVAGG